MRSRTDSFSISQAARRLGLSEKSVRQLCDEGRLACSYTSGGHRRIPAEAVEGFRRGQSGQGRADPGASGASSLLQNRREILEQKRLTLVEIDVDEALEQKREERAEKKAAREATARAPELERQHEAERRRFEERQRAERAGAEGQRREWTDRWIDYGLRLLPQEAPHTLELDMHHEVGKTLAKLNPEQPSHLVQRLVAAAVEKALGPWRREQQIDTILEDSLREHVPWNKRRLFDSLPRTEWETQAYEAADAAIEPLRASGSLAQIQAAAEEAAKSTVQELQHHEECNDILRGVTLWEEQEAARQAVTAALQKLPIGCGRGEMQKARDEAMSRLKKTIADRKAAEAAAIGERQDRAHREQLAGSAAYALPWGATEAEKARAAAAVREALQTKLSKNAPLANGSRPSVRDKNPR